MIRKMIFLREIVMHLQLQWHESAQCFSSRAKKWQNSAIAVLKNFFNIALLFHFYQCTMPFS